MTLIQLEYIVALDDYRHFVTAAEHCHVTQPTLSMQVKKLEEHLGVQIFDRSQNPLVPTEAGRDVLVRARRILAEARQLQESVRAGHAQLTGEFRLGVIPTLAPYLLPRFAAAFVREHPGLRLHIEETQSEDMITRLRSGSLDLGLLAIPAEEPGLREISLYYEPFRAWLSPGHPLALLPEIPAANLPREGLWLLNQGHCFRSQVLQVCGATAQDSSIVYESGSLETLKRMVSAGHGYTLMPELALSTAEMEASRSLDTAPVREIGLAVHSGFVHLRLLEKLSEAIRASVPAHMRSPAGKPLRWR